jgi:hypothetical protein
MAFSIELGFYLVANAWAITPSMPKSPINPPAKNKTTHEAYALRVILFGIPDNLAKICARLNGLNVYVSV